MASTVGYLLDTNVLVHLIRWNPLGQQIDSKYQLRAALNRCMVSVVTIGELHSLARQFGWGTKKLNALEQMLEDLVWIDINHPDILAAYGEIDHVCRSSGTRIGQNDLWIAATAKITGAMLLTTDKDFDDLHPGQITRIWIDPNMGKP